MLPSTTWRNITIAIINKEKTAKKINDATIYQYHEV